VVRAVDFAQRNGDVPGSTYQFSIVGVSAVLSFGCCCFIFLYLFTTIKSFRTFGSLTITTESRTDGATNMSRMTFSGYVGHVTIFS